MKFAVNLFTEKGQEGPLTGDPDAACRFQEMPKLHISVT